MDIFGLKVSLDVSIVALVVAMAAVGGLGILTVEENGFETRVPEQIRNMTKATVDTSHWRTHTCFMESDDKAAGFAPDCVPPGTGPLVLLWGDSYGGALYPGLHKLERTGAFRLAQFTTAGCPPVLNFPVKERPNCETNNDYVLKTIQRVKPDVVLMHSTWSYTNSPFYHIEPTVKAIRQAGAKRIILIGPPPQWTAGLPQTMYATVTKHGLAGGVPERANFGLNMGVRDLDAALHKEADRLGIEYASAWNAFCDPEGCLTRIGETLVTADYGHLSEPAADYLAAQLAPMIERHH